MQQHKHRYMCPSHAATQTQVYVSFTCSNTNTGKQTALTSDAVMFSLRLSDCCNSQHRLGSCQMKQTWKLHDISSLVSDLLASHLEARLEISLSIVWLQNGTEKQNISLGNKWVYNNFTVLNKNVVLYKYTNSVTDE